MTYQFVSCRTRRRLVEGSLGMGLEDSGTFLGDNYKASLIKRVSFSFCEAKRKHVVCFLFGLGGLPRKPKKIKRKQRSFLLPCLPPKSPALRAGFRK